MNVPVHALHSCTTLSLKFAVILRCCFPRSCTTRLHTCSMDVKCFPGGVLWFYCCRLVLLLIMFKSTRGGN